MATAEWRIVGPDNMLWTPAEVAQVVRAAQAFRAALPNGAGKIYHSVEIDGVHILPGDVAVTWPQPGGES